MKSTYFILLLLLIACGSPKAIIAFDDEQAMCIHGKGIGQDAVLGPATTTPREARGEKSWKYQGFIADSK